MRWVLVDKLIELEPGKSAVGVRAFSRAEIFFMDHFPGFPIVPGVLQCEMIAQVGGKCIRAANPDILTVLSSVKNSKFRKSIEPGDQAIIKAEVVVTRSAYSVVKGHIEVDGKKVSEAEVMYGHLPLPKNKMLEDDTLVDFYRRNPELKTQHEEMIAKGANNE